MILPILCATQSENAPIPTPCGYTAPPSRVYCQHCDGFTDAVYVQRNRRATVCFLASFSFAKTPLPHLACKACGRDLFQSRIAQCGRCAVFIPKKCHFCTNCGVRMP